MFPYDATQPNGTDAFTWSCALVSDDAITDWYIRTFGGNIGLEFSYGRIATKPNDNIISMADPYDETFAIQFWMTFRAIAKNNIGRLSLYRILIEIWREDEHGFGCVEKCALFHDATMLAHRNQCRKIMIAKGNKTNSYNWKKHTIHFVCNDEYETTVISNHEINGATEIVRHKRISDIGLFHELLHWLHSLMDFVRYQADRYKGYPHENFAHFITAAKKVHAFNFGYRIDIASYYYEVIAEEVTNEQRKISRKPWGKNYEELRTIWGVPPGYSKFFRNGDDLSENLYRLSQCNSSCIRFGHKSYVHSFEDSRVIDNYLNILETQIASQYMAECSYYKPCGSRVKFFNDDWHGKM